MALVATQQVGDTPGLRQEFALYLTVCGRLAAGVALQPSVDEPVTALHAAGFIETGDDLLRLLDGIDPAGAVTPRSLLPPDREPSIDTLATSMAADHRRFVEAVRRLAPLSALTTSLQLQPRGTT